MNLVEEYQSNTETFIKFIENISDDIFNKKPDRNTWSAAENVEHIIRSEFGTARLFNASTEKDPSRNTERNIQKIRSQFRDRTKKLQAFGVVLPTNSDKDKDELLEKFKTSRTQVIELIKIQDPDEICTRFEHPLFGFMTRREWIHFNIVHTNRHIDQIKELVVNFSKI
ncbi:MAG: DinB family protein [Balneola sp.]